MFMILLCRAQVNVGAGLDTSKLRSSDESRGVFFTELNLSRGSTKNIQVTSVDYSSKYLNALNSPKIQIKFTTGYSYGGDLEIGYFFKHKTNWGIATGCSYTVQSGNITIDTFHVEYQKNDFQGNLFRQLITANKPMNEELNTVNVNIPLLLKYKRNLGSHLGFEVDGSIIYNIEYRNKYVTNAAFDYEAIYQYHHNTDGTYTAVYDNSPVPSTTKDWFITKSQYSASNPAGMNKAFDSLGIEGYNVGLKKSPANNRGYVAYVKSSFGCLLRLQLTYTMSEKVVIMVGGFYMFQNLSNSAGNYKITDNVGSYTSLLHSITSLQYVTYGVSAGIRWNFRD